MTAIRGALAQGVKRLRLEHAPSYALEIPPALREAFGLTADARGAVGVGRG